MRFLKKDAQYREIYRKHRRIKGRYFRILIQQRGDEQGPAFGIIVSKKVGKAVVRNKIKRRIKSYLREREKELPPVISGIIIAGHDAGKIDWETTAADLTSCFKRVKELINSRQQR